MPRIESALAIGGDACRANRDAMLALLQRVTAMRERTVAKSAASRARFGSRGQLLAGSGSTIPSSTRASPGAASSPTSASSAASAA